ncbi:Beta-glucosidase/6-phospho-beta-glucosidase/beta-galactosidase [Bradyrhizobium sp. ORS 375]|uniref:beta-glucosidase n=1 Tax=Bradyrhizobium sp. (strain ORS 375) TaxID=566679 RepID=UPI0002406303|nr:beta-glucosidase [Bradyrhizobium sp. ORS 375]CCD91847.1 Beta-glucosidase/6-phospho-beta-glucosidase/beta-galactosidase [Bradyrhizobium sp. ORS 375]
MASDDLQCTAYVKSALFDSFFIGGFECSTHRRPDGRRLDLIAASGHDRSAFDDYRRLKQVGLHTFRDGLRWHLIEQAPGRYEWSTAIAALRAARRAGVQVIWDLLHYGWPDDIDIFAPEFVSRFARFAAAAARLVKEESGGAGYFCPINEISYFAWAGGDNALMNPFCVGEGGRLKRQLVRASIAAIDAIRAVDPAARIVHAEPLVHIAPAGDGDEALAETLKGYQYEAMDMLTGRMASELGGRPDCLDILGVNYYPDNQWLTNGATIPLGHCRYRAFRHLLSECHARYRTPMFISETGAEGSARAAWLYYVAREVLAARNDGVDLEGLCLYPVLDYPGWVNERSCETGLLGPIGQDGGRLFYEPLCQELIASAACLRRGMPVVC